MKIALFFSSLALMTFNSFAQSLESDLDFLEFKTSSPVYRTEYILEEYEGTCSREIYVGTRESCEDVTETRCRKVAGVGEECWQETTGQSCTSVPDYDTEYYSCTKTRSVPTSVYDHSVTTDVKVNLPANAKEFDLKDCYLKVSSTDHHSSLSAQCRGTIIKGEILYQGNTSTLYTRELKAKLTYEKLDQYLGLLGGLRITNVDSKNNVLKFVAGRFLIDSNVEVKLTATRNRFLAKDKVIKEMILKASDLVVLSERETDAEYSLDLNKAVGNFDNTKKHTFKLELKAKKARELDKILNYNLSNSYEQKTVINN